MSSDSESDELYDNISSKLQDIKKAFYQDKIASADLIDDSIDISFDDPKIDVQELETKATQVCKTGKNKKSKKNDDSLELNATDVLEASELPEVSIPSKRLTRASKRTAKTKETAEIPPKKVKVSNKKKEKNVETTQTTSQVVQTKKKKKKSGNNQDPNQSTSQAGQTPRRNRNRGNNQNELEAIVEGILESSRVINIGVHEGYHDANENQGLFTKSAKTTVNSDAIEIDDSEKEDSFVEQNPEVKVTVCWRSIDYIKFSLRKFQKLSQLYNHFAKKENVPKENLLFTYNDKILSPDDTIDSINYRVVKFIEGGVVGYDVSNILSGSMPNKASPSIPGGISLKFQCQTQRKRYETTLAKDERLIIAMVKYAEHIEKPLEKLKFYLDGEILEPKMTASQADLEGGECIDVKVVD